MTLCPVCGAPIDDWMSGCPLCGTAVAGGANECIQDENKFFKKRASAGLKFLYGFSVVICFVTAFMAIGFFGMGNKVALIDIFVYLVGGIVMLRKKTWVCPTALTVYSAIATGISIAMTGQVPGIVALIVLASTANGMKKLHKEYKIQLP